MLQVWKCIFICICIVQAFGIDERSKRQINFGGNSRPNRGPSFSSRPSQGNSRPNKRPSFSSRPSQGSSRPLSFGGNQPQSKKTSLKELLGKDAPPTVNTRFGFGVRRQGDQCRTPLGEAGTCQYIFSRQCGSILGIILQNGVNAQVLAYLFQAIQSPCGFEGFDFTLCCADPNQPIISSTPAPTQPTPAPTQPTQPTQPPVEEPCGRSQQRNRIVGGTQARQGAWPWAVILGRSRGGRFSVMCGGTLVDEDTIVTAAHCFDSIPGQQGPNMVRLGDHDITTTGDGATPVDISIARSIQHPGWNSNTLADDICIVKLSRPVTYSRNIKRACLPDAYKGQDLPSVMSNPDPVIIGWGSTFSGGGPQDTLRQARVPMVSQQECADAYSAISRVTIGATKLCAGDGRRDTCNGDSGGALLSNNIGGSFAVVGVTSFGVDCAREDFPGVYTRVDQYLDWIRQNM